MGQAAHWPHDAGDGGALLAVASGSLAGPTAAPPHVRFCGGCIFRGYVQIDTRRKEDSVVQTVGGARASFIDW